MTTTTQPLTYRIRSYRHVNPGRRTRWEARVYRGDAIVANPGGFKTQTAAREWAETAIKLLGHTLNPPPPGVSLHQHTVRLLQIVGGPS